MRESSQNRKSIERAHCLDAKPNILLVNRLPQKLDFARVVFLIDISVPKSSVARRRHRISESVHLAKRDIGSPLLISFAVEITSSAMGGVNVGSRLGVKWFADLHPLLSLCTGSSGHKFNVVTIQQHRRFEAVEDYADCVLVAATSNDDAFIIGEARASSVLILNRAGAARRA